MARSELISSLSNLSKKIDRLIKENNDQILRIKQLEKENAQLKADNQNNALLLEKAQKEIEFLILSHRLAASPEALISARNKISQLIRTIDSCIRDLKED